MSTRVSVAMVDERLIISFPYNPSDVERVKVIEGAKWRKKDRCWSCPATVAAIRMMQEFFGSRLTLDNASRDMLEGHEASQAHAALVRHQKATDDVDTSKVPRDLIRSTDPLTGQPQALMEHQLKALALGGRTRRFAYFMDQGTGKTPTLFADAVWAWRRGSIDTLLIITLNSVKGQMVDPEGKGDDELTKFVPEDVPINAGVVQASRTGKERRVWERFEKRFQRRAEFLNVIVVNYEALTVNRIFHWLLDACTKRTMIAADESTRIKAPPKRDRRRGPINRTARACELRARCAAARIMTGTPVIKRPIDAWGQLTFLDPTLLTGRWGSFYAFRSHFCVMGGFQNQHVLFYKNLEDLAEVLSGCSYRVMKDQCVDLPPKVYAPRHVVEMSKGQRDAYEKMKSECLVVLDNSGRVVEYDDLDLDFDFDQEQHTVVKAPIVLTLMLRLQQIAAGYLPVTEETEDGRIKVVDHIELVEPSKNPKMRRALEIIEDSGDQKVIVWARFRKQLDAFASLLRDEGIGFVEYHGGVGGRDREEAKRRFRSDPECKVFLGNQAAGGTGLNLQSGSVMIYLSNDHATETRVQSEDRAHRIGQQYPVTYHDIVCAGTVDTKVLAVLRKDKSLSDMVMGDDPKEWLT